VSLIYGFVAKIFDDTCVCRKNKHPKKHNFQLLGGISLQRKPIKTRFFVMIFCIAIRPVFTALSLFEEMKFACSY